MTKAIYKYALDSMKPVQTIELPLGSKLLRVDYQGEQLVLWAIVSTTIRKQFPVTIFRIGTGWQGKEAQDAFVTNYLNTIQDGDFVWHFFTNGETP